MGTIVTNFLLCYLILYPHYGFAFDHVTIVNEDTIDKEYDDIVYRKNLFQPTSYLNAGYGILYEHIGTVYQSVHTHYLIVGMKIPSYKDIPEPPSNGTKPCVIDHNQFRLERWRQHARHQCRFFNGLANQVSKQAKHRYSNIFKMVHSDIPALLPNQEMKFLSEAQLPIHEEETKTNRQKRHAAQPLSMVELHRMNSYRNKYQKQLPSDYNTLYSAPSCRTCHRHKRFLGTLISGLTSAFKGGNIFGRLISGINKIGGSIFRGIHGLFHHHRVAALHKGVQTFKEYASKLKIGELFKFKSYRDLHISKVSLYDKLNKALHKFGPYMNHETFLQYIHNRDNRTWYYDQYQDLETHWSDGLEHHYLHQDKKLNDLQDFSHKISLFLQGLDTLSTGKLSQLLIHPRRLLKLLKKVVHDVSSKNSQFVPLYTELYHYYETHSVSYTNTDEYLVIQIPIFFINKKQLPLDLYKLSTVPVPLDKDTYDGKESKFTTLNLKTNHIAISEQEYIDLTQHQLDSCLQLHMDHLCPNLRLTASTNVLSCAAAIFQTHPNDELIRKLCDFTYHEHLQPAPAILETQDEILLANLPPTWQLLCDNQIDRPIPLNSAIYAVVNKDDLCTCGILAQHVFLYESMRMCDNPDTSVQLYYTYNKALVSYDSSLTGNNSERYYENVPDYRAPDISYDRKDVTPSAGGSVKSRHRRSGENDDLSDKEITVHDMLSLSYPLHEAVNYMETGQVYYLPTKPAQQEDLTAHQRYHTPLTQNVDFYFNIVTMINFLTSLTNGVVLSLLYKNRQALLTSIVPTVLQTLDKSQKVDALKLIDDIVVTTEYATTEVDNSSTVAIPFTPLWLFVIVLLSMLLVFALYWIIVLIVVPIFRKSSICRYMLPFQNSKSKYLTPATDIFIDIVHITSGEQIRAFLTTITAPACSLSFTGSVRLTNFKLSRRNILSTLKVDWHNCLLHYDNHVIPLPNRGKAFSFQPNLLTKFDRPGPYNIQLLARHMDALLQIPHSSELDFVTASDLLSFPYTHPVTPSCPYRQIHDEVLCMMPLSGTPSASEPTIIDDSENGHMV